MEIGAKIKQRRKELGWTLRELAAKMEYSNHSTVARIESGSIDIPQSKIVKFAEVLGVPIAYLMDWEEEEKKNDVLSDIVVRMRTDDDFLYVVETISRLDSEKLNGLKQMLSALFK